MPSSSPPPLLTSTITLGALTLAWLSTPAEAGEPARPTHAALRRTFEANAPLVVEVVRGKKRAPGVVVGEDGHIVTSTCCVRLHDADVLVGGRRRRATVRAANARTRLALVQLQVHAREQLRAVAVRQEPPEPGEWVVGIAIRRGQRHAQAAPLQGGEAGAPWHVELLLPEATPLFDLQGRLLGLAGRGRRASAPVGKTPIVLLDAVRAML